MLTENSIVNGRYDLAVAQMKKNHVAVAKHGFTMSFLCECSYGRLGLWLPPRL